MIGTTLKFKGKIFKKPTTAELIALFVALAYVVGFIIGMILIRSDNSVFTDFSKNTFISLHTEKVSDGFFYIIFIDFLKFLPFLITTYVFGTCVIGCVFIPSVSIIKGMYDGLLLSYIFRSYELVGLGYSALIFIPGNLVFVFLLILSTRESICFSDRILKNTMPKGTAFNLSTDFKIYSIRYFIILAVSLIGAILNATTAKLFIKYFEEFF